jgi:hypothetical protein
VAGRPSEGPQLWNTPRNQNKLRFFSYPRRMRSEQQRFGLELNYEISR